MGLPSGYKRLEYIQSTGTQYIDTGFKPNQNSRVVADFQLTASGVWQSVFGAWKYTSDYVDSFVFLATSSNFFRTDFGADRVSFSSSLSTLNRHIVDHNKTSVTLDSTTVSHRSQTFSSSYNLNIFAGNTGGTASEFAKMKLYSCKIYDNGTLIRDYIPCQTTAGEIGLWDDVNGVFYGNAGTGTFTAGPVVASPSIFVNINGIWKPINHIYVNINNIWQKST